MYPGQIRTRVTWLIVLIASNQDTSADAASTVVAVAAGAGQVTLLPHKFNLCYTNYEVAMCNYDM